MLEDINQEATERMQKSVNAFKSSLSKIRTGRASPDILDSISLDYYGTETPLKQLSNISVEDSQNRLLNSSSKKSTLSGSSLFTLCHSGASKP